MQTIATRYCAPTNTRGTRISVSAQAGRKMYPWNYALNAEDNHARAAAKYCIEKGWPAALVGGQAGDGSHVFNMIGKFEKPETPAEIIARTGQDDD